MLSLLSLHKAGAGTGVQQEMFEREVDKVRREKRIASWEFDKGEKEIVVRVEMAGRVS